jgi:hypothetical protein
MKHKLHIALWSASPVKNSWYASGPIYGEMENALHIVLRYVQSFGWRMEALCQNWWCLYEETDLKKLQQ